MQFCTVGIPERRDAAWHHTGIGNEPTPRTAMLQAAKLLGVNVWLYGRREQWLPREGAGEPWRRSSSFTRKYITQVLPFLLWELSDVQHCQGLGQAAAGGSWACRARQDAIRKVLQVVPMGVALTARVLCGEGLEGSSVTAEDLSWNNVQPTACKERSVKSGMDLKKRFL